MSERFFVEHPIAAPRVTLSGDEFRHLAAVMRAQPGDEVTLFDGSGAEFTARVVKVGKREAELEITARREPPRELPFRLTLAVALPKGERQKWLVEKLTELGTTRLLPLVTERGVAQPSEAALARLRRGVVEASKQCGRNLLMEIASPIRATDLFPGAPVAAVMLIADLSGSALLNTIQAPTASGAELLVAVGPEGGFTADELAAAQQSGWQSLSLGPRVLRIETAAVAVAAMLSTLSLTQACSEVR